MTKKRTHGVNTAVQILVNGNYAEQDLGFVVGTIKILGDLCDRYEAALREIEKDDSRLGHIASRALNVSSVEGK